MGPGVCNAIIMLSLASDEIILGVDTIVKQAELGVPHSKIQVELE